MRSKSVLASLLLLAACGSGDYHGSFFALGTTVEVRLYDTGRPQAGEALAAVERHLSERGRDWYPWADGELARLNRRIATGDLPVDVEPTLASLIRRAAAFERRSGGLFNAGTAGLTELWGLHELDATRGVPDEDRLRAALAGASLASLHWREDQLIAAERGALIDIGGIAKGALLAECRELLAQSGIDNAIVNLGGDLIVIGNVNGRAARVGIRSPFDETVVGGIEAARGEAVVSSGNYERFVEIDGQRYAHILDPRTGRPADGTASVTVLHPDPVHADAAATALAVGGAGAFDALVAALDLEFALLISPGGDVRLTDGFRLRLDSNAQSAFRLTGHDTAN